MEDQQQVYEEEEQQQEEEEEEEETPEQAEARRSKNPRWTIDEHEQADENLYHPLNDDFMDSMHEMFNEHYWDYLELDPDNKEAHAILTAFFALKIVKCDMGFEPLDTDLIGDHKYRVNEEDPTMVDVFVYNEETHEYELLKTIPII